MAVTSTTVALVLGLQVIICEDAIKKDIHRYLEHIKRHKINIVKMTPSYFKELAIEAKTSQIKLPDLRTLILGGEILHTLECKEWLTLFPHHVIHNEYGPTETTVAVTQFAVSAKNVDQLSGIVPIGKPAPYVKLVLSDDNDESMPFDGVKELYVGGACLARGYLNQPELTAKQFIFVDGERLYKTGDLCRYLADDNLEYVGRRDGQLKIRGYRIEPMEIEACIAEHAGIKEAVIVAKPNASNELQLIAYYIVADHTTAPTHDNLRFFLQQKLADYMLPSCFIQLEAWPLNANGKLDKAALPLPSYSTDIVTPTLQLEEQLTQIWRRAFRHNNIGVHTDFFELGGHSLIAARIIAQIEKLLDKKIRLEDLYQAASIARLTPIVEQAPSCDQPSVSDIQTTDSDTIPLADFQFIFWISQLFEPKLKHINIVARRRLAGVVSVEALIFAIKWVVHRHDVLSYKMAKYSPMQRHEKLRDAEFSETDLTNCDDEDAELTLKASLNELVNHHQWSQQQPAIAFRLFKLKNAKSELQVCVAHSVFDNTSEEILFSELSTAYQHYQNGFRLLPHSEILQYQHFVEHERNAINQAIQRDIAFWNDYLKDTYLLTLPDTVILDDMNQTPYSTYLEIPEAVLANLYDITIKYQASITDIFIAALTLALQKSVSHMNEKIYASNVRSVRDNESHDRMLGCFLRLDAVALNLKAKHNLIQLAKNIQCARLATEEYQACSSMVKMACLDKSYKSKFITNSLVALLSKIYCFWQRKLQLNEDVLTMHTRLNALRERNKFMVVINLLNDFVTDNSDETLFGLQQACITTHQYDLINVNNVLDLAVIKQAGSDQTYLVISGNITPSFRKLLGNCLLDTAREFAIKDHEWSVENET